MKVSIVSCCRDFAALEEEWEDLYQASPLATPFQSWAWLYSWWESYGRDYELCLLTVRSEEGLLVGGIPLMLERRWGFGRLLFIGTGLTDYLDLLARRGWKDKVSEAAACTLKQLGGWQVADLQQLRPEAAAWGIFRQWGRLRTYISQQNCPVIKVKPWDELVASLRNKSRRSTVRQTLRQAESDGIYHQAAKQADVERAARRLVSLHREMWQAPRGILPEHETQRFEDHIVSAARRMTVRGVGGVSEFWRSKQVIISFFWVLGQNFLGIHTMGASQEALRRYQWSSLCIWNAVSIANAKNCSYIDLLGGEEPYKLRWSFKTILTYRAILGHSPISWSPYAGYHVLFSKARQYVHSPISPRWIKSTLPVYRVLRNIVTRYLARSRRS